MSLKTKRRRDTRSSWSASNPQAADRRRRTTGRRRRLACRLRLLSNVPFAYLVPEHRLLPTESIRFFDLNRNWTDAAVDGALSVGAVTSKDRAQLQAYMPDCAWRWTATNDGSGPRMPVPRPWMVRRGGDGLPVRSRAVSGWPGYTFGRLTTDPSYSCCAWRRLVPAVLLVLFDGIPDRVVIEEPRTGVQFGRSSRFRPALRVTLDRGPQSRHRAAAGLRR